MMIVTLGSQWSPLHNSRVVHRLRSSILHMYLKFKSWGTIKYFTSLYMKRQLIILSKCDKSLYDIDIEWRSLYYRESYNHNSMIIVFYFFSSNSIIINLIIQSNISMIKVEILILFMFSTSTCHNRPCLNNRLRHI